jgi:hypothetical protein
LDRQGRNECALDLEKRIRQGDRRDIRRQRRVDDEYDRHLPSLPGLQRLLGKTEAIDLAKVLRRVRRSVARDGLAGQRPVGRVDDLEHHLPQLAGMHVDHRRERPELPWELADVGVEFDAHVARRIDLRVPHRVGLRDVAQAGDLADLLVERHERVAEAEHRDDDDGELRQQLPVVVLLRCVHRLSRRLRPMATTR